MSGRNPYPIAICNTSIHSGESVVISNTKIKLDFKNAVKVRNKSTSFSKRTTTTIATQTKITNRLKITKTFTITGHLVHGEFYYDATHHETHSSGKNKAELLEHMLEHGDTLYLSYFGELHQGVIQTLTIEEVGTQIDSGLTTTGVIVYDISITFVVGVDKLNKLLN